MQGAVNPRYAAYCASNGNTVAQQLDVDRDLWKGGKMAGFILWNRERIVEFSSGHRDLGYFINGTLTEAGHRAYDAWLAERFPGVPA